MGVLGHERDDVVVEEGALRLAGVAPDEHPETHGQNGRPSDETQVAEVERAHRYLGHDQHGHQCNEHPDAGTVVDGPGEDARALAFHRDQQPRHGVGEDGHAGADAEDDDADTDPGDVHPEGARRARRTRLRAPGRPGCGAGASNAAAREVPLRRHGDGAGPTIGSRPTSVHVRPLTSARGRSGRTSRRTRPAGVGAQVWPGSGGLRLRAAAFGDRAHPPCLHGRAPRQG